MDLCPRRPAVRRQRAPIAYEAVQRIDALFEIERSIKGQFPEVRLQVRRQLSAPLVADLERWLRGERALRGVALGRKSWLFAGSERDGQRAAVMSTLIGTAKLNGIDLQA